MPSNSDPMDYIAFRLWGPMASWGDIAVGERRGTWSRPSRSAVLGLVAAALGIERANRAAHDQLEAGIGFAVRVDQPGRPLRDYHTAQSPGARKGKRWFTRRDELADRPELNTILSERSYLTEATSIIVLWRRPDTEGPTLREIQARLTEPVFALYLGRKSCPIGGPLAPLGPFCTRTPADALAAFDVEDRKLSERLGSWRHRDQTRWPLWRPALSSEVWMDAADAHHFGLHSRERTVRRDRVRDRSRWLFSDRDEVLLDIGSAT